jgi:hypothetical protein
MPVSIGDLIYIKGQSKQIIPGYYIVTDIIHPNVIQLDRGPWTVSGYTNYRLFNTKFFMEISLKDDDILAVKI